LLLHHAHLSPILPLFSLTAPPPPPIYSLSLHDALPISRNTLTQRTEGPACSGVTFMDTSNMKSGDYAGLIALQSNFGTIGVQVDSNGEKYITMTTNGENVDRIVDQKLIEHDLIHIKSGR